ncbi:MAG: tetratricopeptide repeat protein [Bacteroidota bacterium]
MFFLVSCGTGKSVKKVDASADNAFNEGNYSAALAAYDNVIADCRANNRQADCPAYTRAGISALKLEQTGKAIEYLENATYTPHANQDTYYYLAKAYRRIDNLSKELLTLEDYVEKFPEGTNIEEVQHRLFETYMESENWEKATALWPLLSQSTRNEAAMQKHWFKLSCEITASDNCDQLAKNLLKKDPEYVAALEFLGEKYFWNAENRYQAEMEAYEKNRTRKQYARLLKALDEVTADFKIALEYFQKLYEINPSPRNATFLSNIYLRFDDKEKSDYYRRKSGN